MQLPIRIASIADVPGIASLIPRSVYGLGIASYRPEQLDAALRGSFGVDTQLIRDATYFVAEDGGRIVAAGGWSRRRTLFGGDTGSVRDAALLDAATDAAKIRAFYVDPAYARRGLGRRLLERSEAAARAEGFVRFELMSTLPGLVLYESCGYQRGTPLSHPLTPDLTIEFVPMHKGEIAVSAKADAVPAPR